MNVNKAYEILKANNMLHKKLSSGCTYEEALKKSELDRPMRRIDDDLVFYNIYYDDLDDEKSYDISYKILNNKKYKILKTEIFPGSYAYEVPKYVLIDFFK